MAQGHGIVHSRITLSLAHGHWPWSWVWGQWLEAIPQLLFILGRFWLSCPGMGSLLPQPPTVPQAGLNFKQAWRDVVGLGGDLGGASRWDRSRDPALGSRDPAVPNCSLLSAQRHKPQEGVWTPLGGASFPQPPWAVQSGCSPHPGPEHFQLAWWPDTFLPTGMPCPHCTVTCHLLKPAWPSRFTRELFETSPVRQSNYLLGALAARAMCLAKCSVTSHAVSVPQELDRLLVLWPGCTLSQGRESRPC